jgi:hypothetical protein
MRPQALTHLTLLSSLALAAPALLAATGTEGKASVNLHRLIHVEPIKDLHFGKIILRAGHGHAQVDHDGAAHHRFGGEAAGTPSEGASQAHFKLTVPAGKSFEFVIHQDFQLTGGAHVPPLRGKIHQVQVGDDPAQKVIESSLMKPFRTTPVQAGAMEARDGVRIRLGATLAVPEGTPGGDYEGTYDVELAVF